MPLDYSRFDNIGDADSEDESPAPPPAAPPPATPPPSAPNDVMDDLEDYFARMEERRQEGGSAPPTVDRFAEADVRAFEQIKYVPSSSYDECSVCLADFTSGETLTRLPCAAGHLLHPQCAVDCLTRSAYCPLCRVDLLAIKPPAAESRQERPVSPRMLGYTRDGGVIRRYEPSPPADMPRPNYVPTALRNQASYVEIDYPAQGVARVWRVPRGAQDTAAGGGGVGAG
jgi:hypothetical protein